MFENHVYKDRRKKLRLQVQTGLILLPGNDESSINYKNNWYPFRQDSNFLYFFGIDQPGLCAIIDVDNNEEIIFGDDPDISQIIFFKAGTSLQDQALSVGVKKTKAYKEVGAVIRSAISKKQPIHYLPSYRPEQQQLLEEWLGLAREAVARQYSVKLIHAIVSLRSIKSSFEIAEIEKAVNVTASMQLKAMKSTRIDNLESEMVGEIESIAKGSGGGLSFPTIFTTDGQVLHNNFYGNKIAAGRLLLCDCGAESQMHYAGDLTRTFPVSPAFTQKQKEIYEVVLNSYQHAVSLLKPGVTFYTVHTEACLQLTKGLIEIGLMKGDAHEAVEEGAHTLFFQCGLGHMMGLDVHDMESLGEEYVGYTSSLKKNMDFGWSSLRLGRALESGFVLTIEPGIYFIPALIEMRKKEKKYRSFVNYELLESYKDFGGIRIEDDYVITDDGYHRLGMPLPTSVAEVETFRREAVEG